MSDKYSNDEFEDAPANKKAASKKMLQVAVKKDALPVT